MKDTLNADLRHLEMLAVSDPLKLLDDFPRLYTTCQDDLSRRYLYYYKAMALISLSCFEEAETVCLELLEKAIEQNDSGMIARANIALSKCYKDMEHTYKEKPCLDIALEAAKRTRDANLIADTLRHVGNYYLSQKDRSKAIDAFGKAEKMLTGDSAQDIMLKLLVDFGSAYYSFLLYDKALTYLSKALDLAMQTDNLDIQLMIINNLSTLYMMLNNMDAAQQMLLSGLKICQDHGITIRTVMFTFSLGVLHFRQDLHEQALSYFLQCEELATTAGFNDSRYLVDLNSNMAGCYRFLGQNEEALSRLNTAMRIAETMNNPALKAEQDVNRANFLSSTGDFVGCRKLLIPVINFSKKNKRYDLHIVAKMNLARSYEFQGDYKTAIQHLLELSAIQSEYLSYVMAEQSKDYDKRIKTLADDYNAVQEQYSALAEGLQDGLAKDFVGRSETHRKLVEAALMAAQHPNAGVLITGESGTGKDVLAHIIHLNSVRRNSPFVAVNMAAISSGLLESEFFGHKRGSFTGATHDTKGFFLEANKGTLFLDEISEMPTNLQAKLLRVLESKKISPVGSSGELAFDTRVLSSTNRDIMDMIKKDLFRLDLYHRLNTIEIHIPPLRERPEDVEALVLYYSEKLASEMKLPCPRIESSFIGRLQTYKFPGNVRELKNIIERLLIMKKNRDWDANTLDLLPSMAQTGQVSTGSTVKDKKRELERDEIISALQNCEGVQKEAARQLGISQSTLTRKIVALNLEIYTQKGR